MVNKRTQRRSRKRSRTQKRSRKRSQIRRRRSRRSQSGGDLGKVIRPHVYRVIKSARKTLNQIKKNKVVRSARKVGKNVVNTVRKNPVTRTVYKVGRKVRKSVRKNVRKGRKATGV